MQEKFKNHIQENLSFLNESKLLIAISGGIDSVALAHLCHSLKLNISLAHCNFNLREEESNKDEDFVLDLAEELDVEIFIQNFDTKVYAKENKRSIQMAARELRYDWFKELAAQLKFDYILTAHHADDNLETFLINFTRGTGLNGLTGIPMINENVVRPLLPFSRAQIEAFAENKNIIWREDASNASRKYLRNKLRHEVVPILKEINPQLLDSFQKTIDNLNDTADIVAKGLSEFAEKTIEPFDGMQLKFKISEFKKTKNPKAYLFGIFHSYGFSEWNDILDLLDAESGKQVLASKYRLVKHRKHLLLIDLKPNNEQNIIIKETEVQSGLKETHLGEFIFRVVNDIEEIDQNTIYIDKEKLNFPLELRLWKKEDTFQPLGMKGKKKVSKYLKDEKLSLVEKENTWVLTSEDKIIWIVGKRADERLKVTDKTKSILKIENK